MHAYSYSKTAIKQYRPNGQHIGYCTVQYIVLHPSLSAIAFSIKLFKNFEELVEAFFNVTSDSLF